MHVVNSRTIGLFLLYARREYEKLSYRWRAAYASNCRRQCIYTCAQAGPRVSTERQGSGERLLRAFAVLDTYSLLYSIIYIHSRVSFFISSFIPRRMRDFFIAGNDIMMNGDFFILIRDEKKK